MAHPYASYKSLHTERLGKMLGGSEREKGPKAAHEQLSATNRRAGSETPMHGGKAKSRADKFKAGGRTKAKTNININVMPQSDAGPSAPPTMPPGLAAAMAPHPPMAPPPGPPMGGPPMGGPPPGMPPGGPPMMPPHKFGGRAYKKGGSVKAESIRNGTKVQHAGQNDKKDIGRKPVITRKDGGRLTSEHVDMKTIKNAAGGGKGRLEKIGLYGGK